MDCLASAKVLQGLLSLPQAPTHFQNDTFESKLVSRMPKILAKIGLLGNGEIMIEVKIDVKLTSDRQLLNTDPVDIFDALAEVFFDDESVTEQEMAADYGIMKIDMDMWVSTNSVEEAFAIGVQAVKAAISAAAKQVPWVSAEIDSISAGQLEAA